MLSRYPSIYVEIPRKATKGSFTFLHHPLFRSSFYKQAVPQLMNVFCYFPSKRYYRIIYFTIFP